MPKAARRAWKTELRALINTWKRDGRPNDEEGHPYAARMSELVLSFPCLRGRLPGSSPWNVCAFAEHAFIEGGLSSGERHAAIFVLKVWNPSFLCPEFDFMTAWSTWDYGNREAFLAWAADPFWP